MKKIFSLLSLIVLVGCEAEHGANSSRPFAPPSFKAGDLSFANVKAAIFEPRCVACHSQYTDYQSVRFEINQISQAIESNRMPKNSSPLSDEQKQLLSDWVQAGLPKDLDSGKGDADQPIDELLPLWESLSRRVFFPKCISCHSKNGEASFLDLTTRQNFFAERDVMYFNANGEEVKFIDFENPEASYLFQITSDPDEPMPPPRSSIAPLNEEELQAVKDWILMGLP